MKTFKYTGVDSDGLPQSGQLQAVSRQQAINILKSRNYIVTKLEEKTTTDVGEFLAKIKGVPKREIVVFSRQLGTMIGAGLPINQAMKILAGQTTNAYFAGVITDMIQQIDGGTSFHEALAAHPKVFDRLYLSLIEAGEASGNLEVILSRLSETMEAEENFKGKVKGAMIYPVIIIVVMIAVLLVMFIFVIPQMAGMYEDMGAELPIVTKLMIQFSDLLVKTWYLMLLGIVAFIVGLKKLMKRPAVAKAWAKLMLKMPVFGSLIAQVQLTSFTRTLSMLVKSGIPLLNALDISKETLGNMIFRSAAEEAAVQVEKGKPLADAFKMHKEFPPLLSEMLAVGEQTGKVDEVLLKISKYYESEASRKTENLASAIEPIVMVLLGVMVGFLVVALILPIYSLTSQF